MVLLEDAAAHKVLPHVIQKVIRIVSQNIMKTAITALLTVVLVHAPVTAIVMWLMGVMDMEVLILQPQQPVKNILLLLEPAAA